MHQPISTLNLPKYVINEAETFGSFCSDHISDDIKHKHSAEVKKSCAPVPTKTALDLYIENTITGQIPTFFKELDASLGGGIPIGLITEFCGEPGSGKTQICYHLCVYVQFPNWCGGINGDALFISTNKSLAPQRLKEIAQTAVKKYEVLATVNNVEKADDFTVQSILERIHSVVVGDLTEFIAAVKYLDGFLAARNVKVVVVDTITAPFKQAETSERKFLYNILDDLQILAHKYKFGVVLTNDMTTRVNEEGAYITPSLGDFYYHRLNLRVLVEKFGNTVFAGTILKSVTCPMLKVQFVIE